MGERKRAAGIRYTSVLIPVLLYYIKSRYITDHYIFSTSVQGDPLWLGRQDIITLLCAFLRTVSAARTSPCLWVLTGASCSSVFSPSTQRSQSGPSMSKPACCRCEKPLISEGSCKQSPTLYKRCKKGDHLRIIESLGHTLVERHAITQQITLLYRIHLQIGH